ncbi:MAG TPA: hypothetical protein VFU89_06920 [Rhabdochlamydiaceae bacterium]|nr:hypothetical protein [Rhabdochlamydiaceae bacterium]
MQVSLQSKFYFCACTAINAYAAFSNPIRWISFFALGVLSGALSGYYPRYYAQNAYDSRNRFDQKFKASLGENPINLLTLWMPGLRQTAIHLLALGLLSQKIQLPPSWSPQIGRYFCDFAAYKYGFSIGLLYQFNILRKSPDPKIKALLDKTTI